MTTETRFEAYNRDLGFQLEAVAGILQANPVMEALFQDMRLLKLDNCYIGAGCVTQSIWNYISGLPLNYGISDIDIVYFDTDLSPDKENKAIEDAQRLFAHLPFRLDVKNQARVHLWYERHFGYPIRPYDSVEDAINSWPTTATAIGVRRDGNGDWSVYAPFGLNDLFGMIVRPNKAQITQSIYEKKVSRWSALWPRLKIVPWH
ncbi:nucleotidyltransferase family protein [Paenibacillus mesophilus]|uniref:nucleotidyltransferase family protein n=1 Tax=Paenibacillus mesophilus TaxID=2582849 RepID=UPI00110F559F|nr:nucleotidyltransferase family protein [Paenibacillus mesophilus]TMV48981.1 nucleotidyltransferase family protein [Paenibacillus mesophilus]